MSGYNMQYFIGDFALRTRSNNALVNSMAKGRFDPEGVPYEVTQLINSLLGLIIIPYEKFKNVRKKPNEAYTNNESRVIEIIRACEKDKRYFNNYPGKYNVFKIIGHLRNSVAHGGNEGLHFYPIQEGGDTAITGIMFYDSEFEVNEKSRNPKMPEEVCEFCLSLHIDEIEELVECISNLYVAIEKKSGPQKEYDEEMQLMNELLRNGRGNNEISVAAKLAERRSS